MVTIRPVRPDEVEYCIGLGVAAFEAIPASDLARERLLGGLAPNGRDWRYRRGQSFLAEFARGARLRPTTLDRACACPCAGPRSRLRGAGAFRARHQPRRAEGGLQSGGGG